MSSRRFVFAGLALAALLGSPATSAAGPIDLSYRTNWRVPGEPGPYEAGPLDFSLDAGGDVSWTGQGATEVGAVRLGPARGPQAADSYTAYTPFEVSVVVTDRATGESAVLALPGGAVDEWTYRAWDGRWTNSSRRLDLGDAYTGNAAEASAQLGHVRYTLAVRPEDDHQTGVYTLTATVTNPEPGTLALGLIALAPVAVRAVRRRGR